MKDVIGLLKRRGLLAGGVAALCVGTIARPANAQPTPGWAMVTVDATEIRSDGKSASSTSRGSYKGNVGMQELERTSDRDTDRKRQDEYLMFMALGPVDGKLLVKMAFKNVDFVTFTDKASTTSIQLPEVTSGVRDAEVELKDGRGQATLQAGKRQIRIDVTVAAAG